eukprot:Skav202735  [mRNA]  locus=scaffold1326:222558:223996:- [translate_table: standard]
MDPMSVERAAVVEAFGQKLAQERDLCGTEATCKHVTLHVTIVRRAQKSKDELPPAWIWRGQCETSAMDILEESCAHARLDEIDVLASSLTLAETERQAGSNRLKGENRKVQDASEDYAQKLMRISIYG